MRSRLLSATRPDFPLLPNQWRRSQTPTDPWQSLIRLLRYRPRSVAEARKRLQGQGFNHKAIEGVLHKAQAAGLLDDALFARLWVEDRILYHPLSRRAVERELTEKGIASEIAAKTMGEIYPLEREKEIALKLAQTRLERYRSLDPERRVHRTIAYLTRRGFTFSLASSVIRALEKGQVDPGD